MNQEPGYVVPVPAIVSLPVAGSTDRFPVRRIYCVGRNYLAHIRELGNDEREPPVFFTKPRDAIVQDGERISYAQATTDFQYELELAVALRSGGRNISAETARQHIFGYAVALDMTRRDLQRKMTSKSAPWDVSKAFDQSCPCATVYPADSVGHPDSGSIRLTVNGEIRQDADLAQMIWGVPDIIAHLSALFELQAGDLILTGTPAGVGPIQAGDVLVGSIAGLGNLTVKIDPAQS